LDTETGPATTFFTLRLNPNPTEFTTSQINAFVWIVKSRNFANSLYLASGLNVPNRGVNAHVNDPEKNCGASHIQATPVLRATLRFSPADEVCVNRAYATPVAHEFGHHFTREVNIANGDQDWGTPLAKKEGTADFFCALLTGQPIIAPDYMGQGTFLRDLGPDVVFPSGAEIHGIGLALAGSFWDLRTNLVNEFGGLGETLAKDLYTNYVDGEFSNMSPPAELDERAGERVVEIDQTRYAGAHKQQIIDAFLPHNLYRLNFIRGDCNGDGDVNISDVTMIGLVINGQVPDRYDACDAEGDDDVDSDDQARVFNWFSGGPEPAYPFPGCGRDPFSVLNPPPPALPIKDFTTCLQSPCPN